MEITLKNSRVFAGFFIYCGSNHFKHLTMKNLIIILLLIIPALVCAQESDQPMNSGPSIDFQVSELNRQVNQLAQNNVDAGIHLKRASTYWWIGGGCVLASAAIIGAGVVASNMNYAHVDMMAFTVAGGIVGAAGVGFMLNVPINWHKAGKKLMRR